MAILIMDDKFGVSRQPVTHRAQDLVCSWLYRYLLGWLAHCGCGCHRHRQRLFDRSELQLYWPYIEAPPTKDGSSLDIEQRVASNRFVTGSPDGKILRIDGIY